MNPKRVVVRSALLLTAGFLSLAVHAQPSSFKTSTTLHTTYLLPGGGSVSVGAGPGCVPVLDACPAGTAAQFIGVTTSVTNSTAIGPGTILVGACMSQSFFVPAGTLNLNTNTHTEYFVNCLAQAPEAPRVIPVLSPTAIVVLGVLLAAGGILAVRRRRC